MTNRQKWIAWVLLTAAAVFSAISAGRPIVIPPLPITAPPTSPPTAPPTSPEEKPDPLNAIVRISRPGVGCSATFVGPRRADGRYWVLSAAHCCGQVGERWVAKFRDGRTTGLVLVSLNRDADYAWLLSDVDTSRYPFTFLAESDPPPGSSIYHAGFGTDNPGNREVGTVTGGRTRDGQLEFRLSVSSGDSGGGIILDADGRLVSPVCCTTEPGKVARVWGASPVVARGGQTVAVTLDAWEPIAIPTRRDDSIPAPMP